MNVWIFCAFGAWKCLFAPQSNGEQNAQHHPSPWIPVSPSNTPISPPTPLTIPNDIRIQLAVLPQYTFRIDRQTHGPTDRWDRWQTSTMNAYALLIESDALIMFKSQDVCAFQCRNCGGLGVRVSKGHRQSHHSIERMRLPIRLNRNDAFIKHRFRVIASYLSKVADFNLPHLQWDALVGSDPVRILPRSLASEN